MSEFLWGLLVGGAGAPFAYVLAKWGLGKLKARFGD